MKKFLFLAAMLLCTLALASQEYKVEGADIVFTEIIEDTGKSVHEAHDALEAFFALRYNDVNSTQKLNQPDHLMYKGLFMNVSNDLGGLWVYDIPHTIDVAIKDNRLRIKISISEVVYRGTQTVNRYNLNFTDFLPENNKKNKKSVTRVYEATYNRISNLFADIENSLNKTTTKEDW